MIIAIPRIAKASTRSPNTARVASGLAAALNQKGGAVTIRLTPESLGTVRVQLQISGATVSAQLHTETEAARAALQQQLGQLRGSLESQGLRVEQLGVAGAAGGGPASRGRTTCRLSVSARRGA